MANSKSENIQSESKITTNSYNYILYFICGVLMLIGAVDLLRGKTEDGLINLVIGTSLAGSGWQFKIENLPTWQRILLYCWFALVLGLTGWLIYTIFFNKI